MTWIAGARFGMAPAALLADTGITATAKIVFIALASRADSAGYYRGGRERLCVDAGGLNPAAVSKCLSRLISAGWIKRQRHNGTWSEYQLCASPAVAEGAGPPGAGKSNRLFAAGGGKTKTTDTTYSEQPAWAKRKLVPPPDLRCPSPGAAVPPPTEWDDDDFDLQAEAL